MNGFHAVERFSSAVGALARHPNAAVLCALAEGACRQAELVERVSGHAEAVVANCLRELDADGFISRRVDPGPPLRVLYELTPPGQALARALKTLRELRQT